MAIEREVKLSVSTSFVLPDLSDIRPGVRAIRRATSELAAVYWDTSDLRLIRAGVTLRHRAVVDGPEPPGGLWTLKLPGPSSVSGGWRGMLDRREVDEDGPPDAVPGRLAALVTAYVRRAQLHPVLHLSSRRDAVSLQDERGVPVAEVDDDAVSVLDTPAVNSQWREVEVELAPGAPAKLAHAVADRLRQAGAQPAPPVPKAVRALGARAQRPWELEPAEPRPGADAAQVLRHRLAAGAAGLVRHDPGVRLGQDDEEVHQARVALRRLRSHLSTLAPLVDPGWSRHWAGEIKWSAGELGSVRDADVLLGRLGRRVAELDGRDLAAGTALLGRLETSRSEARDRLVEALSSQRYLDLLEALYAAVEVPPVMAPGGGPIEDRLAGLAAKTWSNLQGEVALLDPEPGDDQLHQLRIVVKRSRYAFEAAAPAVGKRGRRLAKRLARLQDVLGDHHDSVVAQHWLRRAAREVVDNPAGDADAGREALDPAPEAGSGPQVLVAGQLLAAERSDGARARSQWARTWHRVEKLGWPG